MKIAKCINCGSSLTTTKCSYCNADYSLQLDFSEQIGNAIDPKIKGYYKILDTAFNSENYDESLQYANKIIEIEPENKEIWGVKILSTLNKISVAQFENGSAITLLSLLVNTTPEYAYKVLDIIFNISVYNLKYDNMTNCNTMINNACACLDRGISDSDNKVKILIAAVSSRGNASSPTYNGLHNKNSILYNLKNKYVLPYLSEEEKGKLAKKKENARKRDKLITKVVLVGIASFVLLLVGIALYNQFLREEKIIEKEVVDISFEQKAKISFEEDGDNLPSPDIFIYVVKINGDSVQLEQAIIDKVNSEPNFTGAYYFFENQELPNLQGITGVKLEMTEENVFLVRVPVGKDYWNKVTEFIEKQKPVASTDVDGSQDHTKFYRLADTLGNLGKMINL